MTNFSPQLHPHRQRFVFAALLGLLILLLLSGCSAAEQLIAGPTLTPVAPGAEPVQPPRDIPNFTLTNENGEPFAFEALRGKPSLFYFGYTNCPDVCPVTLAEMSQAALLLGDQAEDVNLVFVSVDGQRDTPERLDSYLPLFNAKLIGLTTDDPAVLQPVVDAFDVFYEYEDVPETQAEYLVAHTASTFLVNAEGQLVGIFAYRTPPAVLAEGLRDLLE